MVDAVGGLPKGAAAKSDADLRAKQYDDRAVAAGFGHETLASGATGNGDLVIVAMTLNEVQGEHITADGHLTHRTAADVPLDGKFTPRLERALKTFLANASDDEKAAFFAKLGPDVTAKLETLLAPTKEERLAAIEAGSPLPGDGPPPASGPALPFDAQAMVFPKADVDRMKTLKHIGVQARELAAMVGESKDAIAKQVDVLFGLLKDLDPHGIELDVAALRADLVALQAAVETGNADGAMQMAGLVEQDLDWAVKDAAPKGGQSTTTLSVELKMGLTALERDLVTAAGPALTDPFNSLMTAATLMDKLVQDLQKAGRFHEAKALKDGADILRNMAVPSMAMPMVAQMHLMDAHRIVAEILAKNP